MRNVLYTNIIDETQPKEVEFYILGLHTKV